MDAAGLLAERDRRPEPGGLRREQDAVLPREEVPERRRRRSRSGARATLRAGRDVTIVALSRLVHEALAAADELARDGIEVEVIDPRTLVPLDLETIVDSVAADEPAGRRPRGRSARRLRRRDRRRRCRTPAFDDLDAPIERVGAPFQPIPFSPPLEDAYLPGADDIAAAARATVCR